MSYKADKAEYNFTIVTNNVRNLLQFFRFCPEEDNQLFEIWVNLDFFNYFEEILRILVFYGGFSKRYMYEIF